MSASCANTSPIGRSIVVRVSYRTVVVPALRVRRPRNASESTVIAVSPILCPRTPTSRTHKHWNLCPAPAPPCARIYAARHDQVRRRLECRPPPGEHGGGDLREARIARADPPPL